MNDHDTAANATISRRRFLEIGTGLVGSLSFGSLLVACGAKPASSEPATQAVTGSSAASSNQKAYLLIAHYNFQKWRDLSDADHKDAEEAAEGLFSEQSDPPIYLPQAGHTPSQLVGVREVRTFASDVFARLAPDYATWPRAKKIEFQTAIYANAATRPKPPVGWMAVIDVASMPLFFEHLSEHGGNLWKMFDVQLQTLADGWTSDAVYNNVPALNNDQTTKDIYLNMTIRSWS